MGSDHITQMKGKNMTKKNKTRKSAETRFLNRFPALRKAKHRLVEPLEDRVHTIERVIENMSKTLALSDVQTRLFNFYSEF